jgi:hypothetical protein
VAQICAARGMACDEGGAEFSGVKCLTGIISWWEKLLKLTKSGDFKNWQQ